jgi:bifunctional DNA-binding transcriptional regulator/antitoxin component of YhaV-PrlF toxin-antitoxin module
VIPYLGHTVLHPAGFAVRDRFGLGPDSDIEFRVIGGSIVLKKAPKKRDLQKWKGHCSESIRDPGYSSVDGFIDDVRGR